MLPLTIHLFQLIVHCYFMYINFDSRTLIDFWNQIKYLTNISNLCMFLFLVPQLIDDLKFIYRKGWYTNIPRYKKWTLYAYQCMNPIIFIVMLTYWILMSIDPKLVFGARDYTQFDQLLLFYVHGGNWILMQLNFLFPQPVLRISTKTIIYFSYVLFYFGIYGIHFYLFQEHVYGFQALLSKAQLVAMYVAMFALLFSLDKTYSIIVLKDKAKQFVQIKNS